MTDSREVGHCPELPSSRSRNSAAGSPIDLIVTPEQSGNVVRLSKEATCPTISQTSSIPCPEWAKMPFPPFGGNSSKRRRRITCARHLMVRILAYRIQEQAFRGLSPSARQRLRQMARSVAKDPAAEISTSPALKAGTRLIRQWQDQTHVVTVKEKGYEYQGLLYQSLSEIARLVTGTRWSGPLFFGLKSNPGKKPGSPRSK